MALQMSNTEKQMRYTKLAYLHQKDKYLMKLKKEYEKLNNLENKNYEKAEQQIQTIR